MGTTTNGIEYPDSTDNWADLITLLQSLATGADTLAVPIFASTALRDGAIPSPAAGRRAYVTATGESYVYNGTAWISAAPRTIVKSADEAVTSSSTLQSDNHITFAIEANSKYAVSGMLTMKAGGATPDVKFAWQMPAGATVTGGIGGLGGGVAGVDHVASDASPIVGATTGGAPLPHAVSQLIAVGGTGGVATLRWAQNVSDPVPSTLGQDSYVQVWKVS